MRLGPERSEQQQEERRARELRREVHVLPRVSRDPQAARVDLVRANFPRFQAADFAPEGATTELRLVSLLTGSAVEFCRSVRGVPFARLCTPGQSEPHARWPLFPVIGADNGPGFLQVHGWNVEVYGRKGQLELTFRRQQDGSLRSYLTRAVDFLLNRSDPRPVVSIRCAQRRDQEYQFSFQNSKDWRAA